MIKIQHKEIPAIAQWHWNEFRKSAMCKKLVAYLQGSISVEQPFWQFLSDHLEQLILGNPHKLEELSESLQSRFAPFFAPDLDNNIGGKLKKIFDYQRFTTNYHKVWNAYTLADRLQVSSCPYCNRQYTHTVLKKSEEKKKNSRIVRPDFDHFMDKASHPYLALSFYNLIPSCSICNSRMKGSIPFSPRTHIHPYCEGFGDLTRFRLKILDVSFFHGNLQAGKIELVEASPRTAADKQLIVKARNNIRDFKLEELYQEHKDLVFELVSKSFIYSKGYLESLTKITDPPIFRTENDLLRFATGNFIGEKELLHRPLSKLTRDIVFQFGL